MKTAPFVAITLLLGAVFIAGPARAEVLPSPLGTLIATQSDQSVTQNLAVGGGQASATSSAGFSGVELSTLHLLIQENGSAATWSGTTAIHFYGNTSCSGANTQYDAPNATIPAGSGFADVYIDLRNVQAVGTAAVQCITVGNLAGIGKNAKYNAAGDTPYYELYANAAIDWNAITFPTVYSTTSAAIAASSTLWGAYASSTNLSAVCNTGNLLGDGICDAGQFLFVPNPHVLDAFFAVPAEAAQRFPFSWIYGVQNEFNSLTVASTTAMSSFSFNLASLGIGSTTSMGNILPNTEVFSKNTIETYISPTLWATFQTLIAAAMWLSFFWYEFNRARNMAKPH